MIHLVNRWCKLMVLLNTVQYCKCIFSYDFLNNIFFSLACFIVRIQYIIHITYKRCVNRLFMLSVRLLINNRLLVVNLGGVKSYELRASLVAQWLRIRVPMQGTWVWSLVREDPTCHGATKPVSHNYWACALEPVSHSYWARAPQLLSPFTTTAEAHAPRARAPQQEKPPCWEACAPQKE